MGVNGIPLINGIAYSWADIVFAIAGIPVTGITAIDYADDQEVVDNYGAGRYPISRSKGKITTTAKITLTMDEVETLQEQSITGRLQDLTAFDIQIAYIPESGRMVKHELKNVQFKNNKRGWKTGDTNQEVELDLAVSHINWKSKR